MTLTQKLNSKQAMPSKQVAMLLSDFQYILDLIEENQISDKYLVMSVREIAQKNVKGLK